MGDMSGCVAEIAAIMVELLGSPWEKGRRIVDRYRGDIPHIDPKHVLLQLRVCYGGFPKLQVRTRPWGDIGLKEPDDEAPLYQLVPRPGTPPSFFTVTHDAVVRVTPLRMPKKI